MSPQSLPAEQEFSELLGELADALQLIYQCHAREVPVTPRLLDYIDALLDRVEQYQVMNAQERGPDCSMFSGDVPIGSVT